MTSINPSPPQTRVALIGLGLMGTGMARRLLGGGFSVTIFNRTIDKAAPLVADGARLASSPREAASDVEIIISMVADDRASRAVWLDPGGALAAASNHAVLLECSTLTPVWIRELAASASRRGLDLLDAPVTGSKAHAAAGELTFLVGGSSAALERARPALTVMSRAIVHAGPSGSGALLKLINNFLCGVQAAAMAEAVVMIERSGLDRATAIDLLLGGAPGSPLVKTLTPRMTGHDYAPNFHLSLMAKDLTYAFQEAERLGVRLSTCAAALGLFERATSAGFGNQDFAAVVEPIRQEVSS